MMVILDYGMGNLRSAQKGFEKAGYAAILTEDPADLTAADGIILPGVGAFKDCYDGLESRGFVEPLLAAVSSGTPLLGICVGMQLLFEESEEGAGSRGLGILPGKVVRFSHMDGLKIPHMGWNLLEPVEGVTCSLLNGLTSDPYVYFVHSYYPKPSDPGVVYATTTYGLSFASVVGKNHVFGTQFHPEKSQAEGIGILRAFGDYVQNTARSVTVIDRHHSGVGKGTHD